MKATEVEGNSKEVGAKVMYQGREMFVSKGVDRDGELKMHDFSGIIAICDALKLNSSLTSLSYVQHSLNSSPKCQYPLTTALVPRWQSRVQPARIRGRKARGRRHRHQHHPQEPQVCALAPPALLSRPFDSSGVPCLDVSSPRHMPTLWCHSLQGNMMVPWLGNSFNRSAKQQLEAAARGRIKLSLEVWP